MTVLWPTCNFNYKQFCYCLFLEIAIMPLFQPNFGTLILLQNVVMTTLL